MESVNFSKDAKSLLRYLNPEARNQVQGYLNNIIEEENREKEARLTKIANGVNFTLYVYYSTIALGGLKRKTVTDIIPLEGVANAIQLYTHYLSNGFSLRVSQLILDLDGETVKTVKFNSKNYR